MVDEGERRRFNPREHLVNIRGKGEYLEVKWRLVWFRSEHPDGIIETQAIEIGEGYAIFKATVSIPGGGSATGYGSETVGDFRDHLEKSETKSLGRALAALGYGTQFTQDFVMENQDGTPHVVDAPVERTQRGPVQAGGRDGGVGPAGSTAVTERQVKFIHALARECRLDDDALADWSEELFQERDITVLSRRDAGALIEALQRRRNEQA